MTRFVTTARPHLDTSSFQLFRMQGALMASLLVLGAFWAQTARAASPSPAQALKLLPVQKGVDYDQPDAATAEKCTISARKDSGRIGWIVESPEGVMLRRFIDTNGDNIVDQWSYYRDGLEVYRDIDADYNGKADQYRWFNTAGTRWGLDKNEDGTIDSWKTISAEEVTSEAIAALAGSDPDRFARLVLPSSELEALGLGEAKANELSKKLEQLGKAFGELLKKETGVTAETKWIQFSGNQPGIVPEGTDGATQDVLVYENVVAIVETAGKHGQVLIGTLVKAGDAWRLIDVPQPIASGKTDLAATGFFFQPPVPNQAITPSAGPSEAAQKTLAALEELDQAIAKATGAEAQAKLNARRADLLEQVAGQAATPDERVMWLRQLADTVSAAVQTGTYPDGGLRLKTLYEKLKKNERDRDMAAYVLFRQMTSDYAQSLSAPKADYAKIQEKWVGDLEQFVKDYPKCADAAEAMLQLAMTHEFAGEDKKAGAWYERIVKEYPDAPAAEKAAGARRRLDSVGKQIRLQGKTLSGDQVDLDKYRGRPVVVQFWATWSAASKTDMATLKELIAKYGKSGFSVIGVNLDSSTKDVSDYLTENKVPWPQIFEEGGLDSRPANELGIITVPTMILIDQKGNVVRNDIRVSELDSELKKLIR